MHILLINYYYEADMTSPYALLERYFSLTGWVQGLQQAGVQVTVFQRFCQDVQVERDRVIYHFVQDGYAPRLRAWQLPWRLHRQAVACVCATGSSTLVHVNGLLFPLQARHLRTLLPRDCGLTLQHHAERPWSTTRRWLQRWGLGAADAYLFTNRTLATEWASAGLLALDRVYEVMECSSLLPYQERTAARAVTQMVGAPLLFWSGNLTANKDPLTILAGLELLLPHYPHARLYMAYRATPLLSQVQERIAQSATLRQAVTLLGAIPYSQIGAYYNSADLFVQGSTKEGSGIALLDALACGVVPVVTDIPAFRTITCDGAVGALWPVGDVKGFVAALQQVLMQPLLPQSERARTIFTTHWNFPAIGQRASEIYDQILHTR